METKVNYTVVGLFVILLGTTFFLIFFWLAALRHDKVYKTYLVFVKENVAGLSIQSQVRFNGVPVGFVKNIEIDLRNPLLVKLTLRIEEDTPITTSTVAELQFQGITGVMYVGLKSTTQDSPLLVPRPGQKYPIIPAQPSLIVQLSEVLPELTKNVQKIGKKVDKLFDEKNLEAIQETLQNVQKFTRTLSKNSKQLDESIQSLHVTLNNTAKASKDLPATIVRLKDALGNVKTASKDVSSAAISVKNAANSGQAAVNSLSQQLMPELHQTLMRFNGVAGNLQHLSAELQRNPAALIRGKQPAALGPGEQ